MSATYVIDGYNLLHAMGVLGGRAGPGGLEKARGRLVRLLHRALGEEAAAVTVVFDGTHALPGMNLEQHDRGLRILYSRGPEEADDVIEGLIHHASAPKTLHVVSDDHRVQQAASRRGCQVRGCEEFLAWLPRHAQSKGRPPELPEKKDALSKEEIQRWLAEFGDVERDPYLKKAFESYDFELEE